MNSAGRSIRISIPDQRLRLLDAQDTLIDVAVSTSAKGAGEQMNSECTPRGWHMVRAKIGATAPINAVFVARRPTGELCTAAMREREPGRDWILTRILWLSGLEPGRNRLGKVDTMRRFIYIHGAPDDVPMGIPGSHGCVRMRNEDVIALFDQTPYGTPVLIED